MSSSRPRPHSSRVVLAESWRELLGTRRFIVGSVLGLIALYYYFLVYHATPVIALATETSAEADAAVPAPLFHDVIALENVQTTATRIKYSDRRAPKSAAEPAPTIDDILQHIPNDVTCRCSPTPVLMKTLSDDPLISNFAFQASLVANSSFWKFNLTTVRDALPAPYKQRALSITRSPNVLSAARGRVLPTHTISDEIGAQLHAFNEAKKLQNNVTLAAAKAAKAAQTAPAAFIELDASVETEAAASASAESEVSSADSMESDCVDDECANEVRLTWPQREPRSVDDIVNELHAMIPAESRLSAL